ncbi:MAG TPA: protein-L-isoaspartate O-methyltransferase [Woeseiaceae bacterium]|nr:protein-L-isoaspartate O-methyltransferase [Woeseiaceae bacterium]
MDTTEFARRQMVAQQIRAWEVFDTRTLAVLAEVPRERFVPAPFAALAFAETQIPLGHDQYMMPPTLEGRLLQSLKLLPIHDVLEIGTGSGFLAACLSRLARSVTTIDIFPDLARAAAGKLADMGYDNVTVKTMDAAQELPEGPFDAIALTASLPTFDPRFVAPLKPGGRLFAIVGDPPVMDARLIVRGADGSLETTSLFETNVPPLLNAPAPPAFRF